MRNVIIHVISFVIYATFAPAFALFPFFLVAYMFARVLEISGFQTQILWYYAICVGVGFLVLSAVIAINWSRSNRD